jgi:hypothetical protein
MMPYIHLPSSSLIQIITIIQFHSVFMPIPLDLYAKAKEKGPLEDRENEDSVLFGITPPAKGSFNPAGMETTHMY